MRFNNIAWHRVDVRNPRQQGVRQIFVQTDDPSRALAVAQFRAPGATFRPVKRLGWFSRLWLNDFAGGVSAVVYCDERCCDLRGPKTQTLGDVTDSGQCHSFVFADEKEPRQRYRAGWLGMDELIITDLDSGTARAACDADLRRLVITP